MSSAIRKLDPNDGKLDVERARDMLARCVSLDDIADFRDKAKAVENYQRSRKAGAEAEASAAEIVVRCERRLGELLAAMPKATGSKGAGRPRLGDTKKVSPKQADAPPTLLELGISAKDSAACQKLAAVPETAFEQAIVVAKNEGKRPSAKGVIAESKPKEAVHEYANAFNPDIVALEAANFLRRIAKKWPPAESKAPLILSLKQLLKELER